MGLLTGRVVIVTGAARPRSIGDAIAARMLEEGATVLVTSRDAKAAEAAAARLGPNARGAGLDLTSEDAVRQFARDALRSLGRIDAVVHNAGYPVADFHARFLDVPTEAYARVFDVDVLGALRLTKAVLPAMMEQRSGSLVFTSSTAGLVGYEGLHEFAPAKAGVLGLMRDLAAEHGKDGVRSNAVAYGNIASAATYDPLPPDVRDALAAESPMRRWGQPREAAGACVFLASDLASFVNGQVIVVDGGTVRR